MKNTRRQDTRQLTYVAALVTAIMVFATSAMAAFPERPVRLIVPYPPGGTSDNVARALQEPLSRALGQTIIIENISGSAGTVGTGKLAHAKPNGYAMGINAVATLTSSPHLTPVNYDLDSFKPVARLAISYLGIAARKDFPASNFKEFVEYAKKHRVTISDTGIGATTHLCVEQLKKQTGGQFVQVPFKGSGPSVNAAINGHVDATCDIVILDPVRNGLLKPIITLTPERWDKVPDTPTYKEITGDDFPLKNWYVALVPAGTPADRVATLRDAIETTLEDPSLKKRFASMGIRPYFAGSQATKKQLENGFKYRGQLLRELGLTKK